MQVYISKADQFIDVDWNAMPQNAKDFIIAYGLKQKLNDKGASATVKELGPKEAGEQALAMAETIVSALMEGKVTVREAKASMSAEERITVRVARSLYKKFLGKKPDDLVTSEGLINAIALKLNKDVQDISIAIAKRVEAELLIESQKKAIPTIEL